MLKLPKIAVTGGLCCGKSSVCLILKELSTYVVSADKVVHQLLSTDEVLAQKIVNLLGPEVLVEHKLDRSRIATIVFQNLDLLYALEKLIHPAVYKEINKEYLIQTKQSPPPPLFVAEVPLLFESGGQNDFDTTIAVISDQEKCQNRFYATTHYDQKQFKDRMTRQFSLHEKAALADEIILNNGSLSDLHQTTTKLFYKLIEG